MLLLAIWRKIKTMKKEVDKIKTKQVVNFLHDKAGQNPADSSRLRAMSSSFTRIYKETASPSEDWSLIETNQKDLERRLRLFEIKMRPKFKSPDLTLPSYNSRARRALNLYIKNIEHTQPTAMDVVHPSPEISFTIEQLNRQLEIMRRYLETLSAIIEQNAPKRGHME